MLIIVCLCILYTSYFIYFLTYKCCYFSYLTGCKYSHFSVTVRGKRMRTKTNRKNIEYLLVKQVVLQTPIQIPWGLRAFQLSQVLSSCRARCPCAAQSQRCAGTADSYIWSAVEMSRKIAL